MHARIFPPLSDKETDRQARESPRCQQLESGLWASCRSVTIKFRKRPRKSSHCFKQQQAGFLFTTARVLALSLSNLQCSRTSRWLVGTEMLPVTQNRSGTPLADACGICLANLLLLWGIRFLWNVYFAFIMVTQFMEVSVESTLLLFWRGGPTMFCNILADFYKVGNLHF